MSQHSYKPSLLQQAIPAMLLFFIVWEWLRPLPKVTMTDRIDVFLIALLLFIVVDVVRLPWWGAVPLKGLLTAFIMNQTYFHASFISIRWIQEFVRILQSDMALMVKREFMMMDPVTLTFGFLILIWMAEVILFYRVVVRHQVWSVLFITVVYLASLEVWAGYPAKWAVIRTIGIGLLLLAFSNLPLIEGKWNIRRSNESRPFSWVSAALVIVLLIVSIGFYAPKSEASWPDPVSLFQNAYGSGAAGLFGASLQKVGYGDSDVRLGGPFVQDTRTVFVAETKRNTYWRGESKSFYTGTGWWEPNENVINNVGDVQLKNSLYTGSVDSEVIAQKVAFDTPTFSIFFSGGEVRKVNRLDAVGGLNNGLKGAAPVIDTTEDASKTSLNSGQGNLRYYEIDSKIPFWDEKQLRQANSHNYSNEFAAKYLQLPQTLPNRVRELARQITNDKSNNYDKAKEIEYYLKSNFPYEIEKVSVPPKDRDFVDYFLFDEKKGYCDYFSTSMVVMLRSSGIPARWVKGFAPGEVQYDNQALDSANGIKPAAGDKPATGDKSTNENPATRGGTPASKSAGTDDKTVLVRNKNAHSWVEAYFQGIGWVPFEPTPSFTSHWEYKQKETAADETTAANVMKDSFNDRAKRLLEEQDVTQASAGGETGFPWLASTMSLVVLLAAGLLLWMYRHPIWFWNLARKYRDPKKGDTVEALVLIVMKVFSLFGLRSPELTLREYISRLPTVSDQQRQGLWELSEIFEQNRYGQEQAAPPFSKLNRIWNKINRNKR